MSDSFPCRWALLRSALGRLPYRKALVVPLLIAAALSSVHTAPAQEPSRTLLESVLANPADLERGYRYALALIDEGRYQAAASELERLLIIEPDQPRLRLELGVLYFRLGQYELSQSYLRRALETPGITPAVRDRLQYYHDEAQRRSKRSQFSGSLSFGARYQTNANGGPTGDVVRTAGGTVRLPPNLTERSDINAYIAGDVTHSYDLDLQRSAAIVSTLTGYATRQTQEDFYNFTGVSLRSGPRFAPAPADMPELRIYPYLLGDLVFLNDEFYNASVGPGLEVSHTPTNRLALSLVAEGRFANYDAVPKVPGADVLTGDEVLAFARAAYRIDANVTAMVHGGARNVDTERAFLDFYEFEAGAALALLYPAPIVVGGFSAWNASAGFGHFWRTYGGPDPAVDPGETRREKEWRLRATNEIPIVSRWSLIQQIEYRTIDANIQNYDRDNFIVVVGATLRF